MSPRPADRPVLRRQAADPALPPRKRPAASNSTAGRQKRQALPWQAQPPQPGCTIFADDEHVDKFDTEQIVDVEEPWRVLYDHISKHSLALVRAPPRSGKTMLGMLASKGVVQVLNKEDVQVRYCEELSQYKSLLREYGYKDVKEMAQASHNSWKRKRNRCKIVYYFDEAHDIPEDINRCFVKNKMGYAVFATASVAKVPETYVTPPELLGRTFYFTAPAERERMSEWLASRLAALFKLPDVNPQVQMGTELLLTLSGSHVGILQFLGVKLEQHRCRDLRSLRDRISSWLCPYNSELRGARCFGAENGAPDVEQSCLVSMLRCCGSLAYRNAANTDVSAWREDSPAHRRGLSKALFAPMVTQQRPLSQCLDGRPTVGFTHALQPEIYAGMFANSWRDFSQERRWLVNFAHGTDEMSAVPTNVIDLVVSWLSHVQTDVLVSAMDRIDPPEALFQLSFNNFCIDLGLTAQREQSSIDYGGTKGFIDHLVHHSMGVEFLIRSSRENRYNAAGLLRESGSTRKSLLDHAARADERAAQACAQSSYAAIARQCNGDYITVLPATLTESTADTEWEDFQGLIAEMRRHQRLRGALELHIMVAVATFGWAGFDVFLHQRNSPQPVRFTVPRQRLMLKVVKNSPEPARHYYPRPSKVWVQRLVQQDAGDGFELRNRAIQVAPEDDSVGSLIHAIVAQVRLTESLEKLRVFQLKNAERWEEISTNSQVLYANVEGRPYGYFVAD